MDTATEPLLFDSTFLAKLEQLYLLSKRIFRGDHRAERRSRHLGASLEFADYRNYAFGDDLRAIDWNIYARLDRLFVKLFEHEQDLQIYFLVDASASMRWQPEDTAGARHSKFSQARRIAASLAYIALANLDRVNVHWFGPELGADLGFVRGKAQFHQVLDFLRAAPAPAGATRLLPSFREFAQRQKRRGLAIVLSDLFDADGCEEALSLLRYHQFEVQVLHVLDPAELRPAASGDLRLADCETGAGCDVTASEGLLRRYHAEIDRYLAATADFCTRRGVAYAQAPCDAPFEDVVLRALRGGGIVK